MTWFQAQMMQMQDASCKMQDRSCGSGFPAAIPSERVGLFSFHLASWILYPESSFGNWHRPSSTQYRESSIEHPGRDREKGQAT
jgi:hypothetical protein